MIRELSKDDFAHMMEGAAQAIRAHSTELSQLDSVGGDGDHGTTMLRVVDRLELGFRTEGDLKAALSDAGQSVLGADGGASSAIFGSFFLGMSNYVNASLDSRQLACAFEGGLGAVCRQTKAQPGEKTLIDALVPAVQAARAAADNGGDVAEALHDAACAARAGAESTRNLISRYGRAKYAREKTRGHPDPGAVSVALMFEGFARALNESKGSSENA